MTDSLKAAHEAIDASLAAEQWAMAESTSTRPPDKKAEAGRLACVRRQEAHAALDAAVKEARLGPNGAETVIEFIQERLTAERERGRREALDKVMDTIPRWSLRQVDHDDEVIYDGMETDENGLWVGWDELQELIAAILKSPETKKS